VTRAVLAACLLCGCGVTTLASRAVAQEPPPRGPSAGDARTLDTRTLEERVARLEEEAKQAKQAKQAAAAAARPIVDLSGYVQVDWTLLRQSSQDEVTQATASQPAEPLNENRLVLRRGIVRAERDGGLYHAAVELEANTVRGPQVRPANVEASVKWPAERAHPGNGFLERSEAYDGPWFVATAGLFRTPFGFDVQERELGRAWLDRTAVTNALFPQALDLGVRLLGGWKAARYSLGIMNGDPVGERAFPGRDPNESKDLVFRVGAVMDVSEAIHIEGGVSGLTGRGFHQGQPATKDSIAWRDQNEDGVVDPIELQSVPGTPATPSSNFKRFAIGADLRATVKIPVLGDLGARAEIVRASNLDRGLFFADPVDRSYDLRELGWHVGVHQEITRWAMIGVRYDRYDPDADAREREPFALVPRSLALSTWAFSATARFGFARLVAEYDRRNNAFGRDVSGAPTTLADDSFTLRAEVRF
jgi:hypothetical protein